MTPHSHARLRLGVRQGPLVLTLLVIAFLTTSLVTLACWHQRGVYGITGDEPHYLVMAHGLATHFSLEQSGPYRDAFRHQLFYPWAPDTTLRQMVQGKQLFPGPHGYYSVHNMGLPLLLAIPSLFGVTVAKTAMLGWYVSALCCLWLLTARWTTRTFVRGLALSPLAVTMPLLGGATQIYPDIPAGVLGLWAIYWILTVDRDRPAWRVALLGLCVAYLPWLQIKFSAAALLLAAILFWRMVRDGHRPRLQAALLVVGVGFSFALLLVYNLVAFGHAGGPYGQDALEVNRQSLMVVTGLLLDQDQGLLWQNPLYLVGLVALPLFARRHPAAAVAVVLGALSIIVPNGLHTNWYGGYSLSGRFEWSAWVMATPVIAYAVINCYRRLPRATVVMVGSVLAVELWFWFVITSSGSLLYNKGAVGYAGVESYSNLYWPVARLLPAFYDRQFAYASAPNATWILVLIGLLAAAALSIRRRLALSAIAVTAALVGLLALLLPWAPRVNEQRIAGKDLATPGGIPRGDALVLRPSPAGVLAFTPAYPLRTGHYSARLRYQSRAADPHQYFFEVVDGQQRSTGQVYLPATHGAMRTATVRFVVRAGLDPEYVQFRTQSTNNAAQGTLKVRLLSVGRG